MEKEFDPTEDKSSQAIEGNKNEAVGDFLRFTNTPQFEISADSGGGLSPGMVFEQTYGYNKQFEHFNIPYCEDVEMRGIQSQDGRCLLCDQPNLDCTCHYSDLIESHNSVLDSIHNSGDNLNKAPKNKDDTYEDRLSFQPVQNCDCPECLEYYLYQKQRIKFLHSSK